MRVTTLARSLAACALLFAAAPSSAQEAARRQPLVGMWLVEAQDYDAWTDAPVDLAAYPLLVVRADGSFTLYRLMPACFPILANGKVLGYSDDTPRKRQMCWTLGNDAEKEGFQVGYLHKSAEGRVQVGGDGRVRFVSTRRGPATISELDGGLAFARERAETASESAPSRETRAAWEAFQDWLKRHEKRYATFYSTFYVFDGKPAEFAVAGGTLRLTLAGESLTYRAIRAADADTAFAPLIVAEGRPHRYFRCVLAKLESEAKSGGPRSELVAFALHARGLQAAARKEDYADMLRKTGRAAEAERLWPKAQAARHTDAMNEARDHRLARLGKQGRLGAEIGCPDRDDER